MLVMQEMQVESLGWDDPLEKEMATCLSILAWETAQKEKPDWATDHDVPNHHQMYFICESLRNRGTLW